jgi:hypothetical protein
MSTLIPSPSTLFRAEKRALREGTSLAPSSDEGSDLSGAEDDGGANDDEEPTPSVILPPIEPACVPAPNAKAKGKGRASSAKPKAPAAVAPKKTKRSSEASDEADAKGKGRAVTRMASRAMDSEQDDGEGGRDRKGFQQQASVDELYQQQAPHPSHLQYPPYAYPAAPLQPQPFSAQHPGSYPPPPASAVYHQHPQPVYYDQQPPYRPAESYSHPYPQHPTSYAVNSPLSEDAQDGTYPAFSSTTPSFAPYPSNTAPSLSASTSSNQSSVFGRPPSPAEDGAAAVLMQLRTAVSSPAKQRGEDGGSPLVASGEDDEDGPVEALASTGIVGADHVSHPSPQELARRKVEKQELFPAHKLAQFRRSRLSSGSSAPSSQATPSHPSHHPHQHPVDRSLLSDTVTDHQDPSHHPSSSSSNPGSSPPPVPSSLPIHSFLDRPRTELGKGRAFDRTTSLRNAIDVWVADLEREWTRAK